MALLVLIDLPLVCVNASSELWSQTYGGKETEEAYSLVATSDGGYALAGFTRSFGEENQYNGWLVKTDAQGNKLWNRTYGEGIPHSLIETSDGGYAIGGNGFLLKTDEDGNVKWKKPYSGMSVSSVVETSNGSYVFAAGRNLVKTDSFGNIEWNQTYGGEKNDYFYGLVELSDDGYVLAGKTSSFGAGEEDFWLIKIDLNGSVVWSQTYGGPRSEVAYDLIETSDGGYALAGGLSYIGAPITIVYSDFLLVKTDSEGKMQWSQTYNRGEKEIAYSLVETSDEGYVLAGPSFNETITNYSNNFDFWLVKTDPNGNPQWNQTYGGTQREEAHSLVQTSDGGFALAGLTRSFGAGASDFWLIKTDAQGIPEFSSWFIFPIALSITLLSLIFSTKIRKHR